MSESQRVLVIGLDAADKDLVRQWADQGLLPTFRRLMQFSTWGEVENPRAFEAGTAWPSFFYGSPPGEHGQYDGHRHFNPKTYRFESYKADELTAEPIWSVLARQGKSSILIDAPYMHLPRHENCLAVTNWGTHTPIPGHMSIMPVTNPPDLADEVIRRFGTDPLGGYMCDHHRPRTRQNIIWFRDALIERVEKRTEMALHFMQHRPWDFFLAVYSECHCVGHHCWHLHDPTHREYDPAVARAVGDPMKDVYVAVDRAVGRLLDACPDTTRTVIYLSHGMEAGYTGTRLLDRILARLDANAGDAAGETARAALRTAWSAVWRSSPEPVKRLLNPLRKKARAVIYHEGFLPHRQRRRFFEVYGNDRSAGIRINLIGREAQGIVQPGEEYEQVCRELSERLLEMRNDETGEPLVAEVVRTGERHDGRKRDWLPDLMVTWNRRHPINVVSSPRIGRLVNPHQTVRSGDHSPVGMFFATGPGVPTMHVNDRIPVIDFAPTMSSLLRVSSDGFVGRSNPVI